MLPSARLRDPERALVDRFLAEGLVAPARRAFEGFFDFAGSIDALQKARFAPSLAVERVFKAAQVVDPPTMRRFVSLVRRPILTARGAHRPRRASYEDVRAHYEDLLARARDFVEDFRVGIPLKRVRSGDRAREFAGTSSARDFAAALGWSVSEFQEFLERPNAGRLLGSTPEVFAKTITRWAFASHGQPLSKSTMERALARTRSGRRVKTRRP
jgi:hypothetical protein